VSPDRQTIGPNLRRALVAPVEGTKRRKVLATIAACLDVGRDDPSISELARRAKLSRLAVVAIVDRLERDGLLEVERGLQSVDRNRYSLLDRRPRS
jgi:DNA-binding MarR family transcriptional regulator